MEGETVNVFAKFLDETGVSKNQKNKILDFYIALLKQEEFQKKCRDIDFEEYCKQIISMVSENPDLNLKTYIDYITLVFGKVQNTTKIIKIS